MSLIQEGNNQSLVASLKRMIADDTLKIGSRGHMFTLNSGKESPFYYEFMDILLTPGCQTIVGKLIYEEIKIDLPDSVGGLATGAIPIASAVARESLNSDKPLRAFYILKEVNEKGKFIEGNIKHGDRVVILDDVGTTGKALVETVKQLKKYECKIVRAICILDRQQGAREAMESLEIPFTSLLTHEDFKEILPE